MIEGSSGVLIIDSSVFYALVRGEPEAEALSRRIGKAQQRLMSAGNYVECSFLAIARMSGRQALDEWLDDVEVEIVPVDRAMAEQAAEAFARFGKGRHKAKLNYGDCFAYALSKSRNAPLLYKGGDFALTDLAPASP
jgi:ribonuclease VapC